MKKIFYLLFVFVLIVILVKILQPRTLAVDCSKADVNGDGIVDFKDTQAIGFHYTDDPTSPLFNTKYDQNNDNKINELDTAIVNSCFTPAGTTPTPSPIPPPQLPSPPAELTEKGYTAENFIGKLVSDILPIILGFAGFITVIFIIISGIQFVTSSGNPEAAAAARNRLIFALVGFVIIILAFAITQIVDRVFLGGTGVL